MEDARYSLLFLTERNHAQFILEIDEDYCSFIYLMVHKRERDNVTSHSRQRTRFTASMLIELKKIEIKVSLQLISLARSSRVARRR